MHIHRRNPQLITSAWVNPADPAITVSDDIDIDNNDTKSSESQGNLGEKINLSNRGADANAETSGEAGEVVSHRLDQTYPDIPRPTPIKLHMSGGEESTPPVLIQGGDINNNNNNGDTVEDPDENEEKEDEDEGSDEKKEKGIEDIARSISLPGLPLGMLGPLMGPINSISSVPDNEPEGIMEIEVIPSGGIDVPAFPGMQDRNNNNNMVEEIWITTDDFSPGSTPPGAEAGMFNPLDMLANQLESIMGGIFGGSGGGIKPEEKKLGQPIDEVMLPNGLPQKGPEVLIGMGGEGITVNTVDVGGGGPVKRGWEDVGKVVGIVMLSVIGPVVVITALGCGITMLVKRVRSKRRGYREVQAGLCGDEEWN
ncbi:hypothetical protein TWF679_008906 [Orbilia oligospora]|uniref:Uncharacterized protein n=1 Tax=Orbilia oligospora TaxID=2813651 RepID=A0A8H8VJU4_ORBOL|nr:hypothetical protein TWF679_008906 [Orbilia oligospora]